MKCGIGGIIAFVLGCSFAPGQTTNSFVVPATAETTSSPHGAGTFRDPWRYQQVYGGVEFPQQPILIRELRFRPDAAAGTAFTTTVANIQFNLSTTARNPNALSAVFNENLGTNDTIVFQGALPISSQFVGPASGPKAFDIVVPLSQPFLFDPAAGNLVVDVRNFSGSSASVLGGQAGPDSAGRVMGTTTTAMSGVVDSGADAIQIVYAPATNLPPWIIVQPKGQAVLQGGSATFAVTANGSVPLNYQWRKGETAIVGATNASLTITNVQRADGGDYLVVVSNAFGTATSEVATLMVQTVPEHVTVVPKAAENTETPYGSGTLRDAGIRNQQVYGSIEFPQQPMVIEELRFRPDARFGRAFSVTVSNIQINLSTTQRNPSSLSSTFSQNIGIDDTIVFEGPLTLSSQFAGPTNGPKAFDIIVTLSQPFLYDPASGNLVIDIRNFSGSTASHASGQTGPDSASRVIGSTTATTGTVDVGADAIQIVFSPATNAAPRILVQPLSQAVIEGSNVTFSVSAIGNAPLIYQWRFNGVSIAGGTRSSFTITNVHQSDAGLYSVSVENAVGAVLSSNAMLSVVTRTGLVVPVGLDIREGVGAFGTLTDQLRLQEVYGASQFPPGNLYITELRFRPSAEHATGPFSTTIDNVEVKLSTTVKQPNNLSLIFAENTGSNELVVYNGALSITSQFSGPAAGPKGFDISLPLQTPFLFNRAEGNLLIDIRNFSGAPFRYVVDTDNAVDQASRVFATSASATQAVTADNSADVLQIIYSTTNTAPQLISLAVFSGQFALAFGASGTGNYVTESSTNLVNWTVLTNVIAARGRVEVVDPQASELPQRFYRARVGP